MLSDELIRGIYDRLERLELLLSRCEYVITAYYTNERDPLLSQNASDLIDELNSR